jgi:hypothetical protein
MHSGEPSARRQSYTARSKEGPEANKWNCYLSVEPPIPIEFSIIVGDALHNMRSGLDHLVARLVEIHGGVANRHHAFPIYGDEAEYEGAVNQLRRKNDRAGPLDGIPAESPERALIQESQPYHRGDRWREHPLAILNKMSNIDKHRAIHVAATYPVARSVLDLLEWSPSDAQLIEQKPIWQPGQPLEDRTHLARLRFSDTNPATDVRVKADLPIQIAFGEGAAEDLRLEDVLAYVRQIVSRTEVPLL